ncbi:MAG: pyridoxal phosphate-dependent aminotransferase [Fervidicoccaceae archaeon]
MRLSPLLEEVQGEQVHYYAAKARELERRRGVRVINFGVGQPDLDTPEHIKDEAKRALDAGFTGYTDAAGIRELREAIADYLRERTGADVRPDEVVVTTGGKTAIFMALAAAARPGSEVVIVEPAYYAYPQVVKFLGARPVYASMRWSPGRGHEFDVDEIARLIGERTSAVVLNSPHNPTGAVLEQRAMEEIVEEASRVGAAVISDEVYEWFVYEGSFASVLETSGWRDSAILVQSFSKTFRMTGWRLGYVVARRDVAEKLVNLAVTLYTCAPSFVQKAGVAALRGGLEEVEEMVRLFDERRRLAVELLRGVPGLEVPEPRGAFYVFPRAVRLLEASGLDERAFAERLLEEEGVLVTPGTVFPKEAGRGFVRLSYAMKKDLIVEGISRLRAFAERILSGARRC